MTHVVILGGGPAGVGAARELRKKDLAQVTLFERGMNFGGNAGSFDHEGHSLDYGSHRLHPACAAPILRDIQELMGDELLDRPRHGRIRLHGQWLRFPLEPLNLLLNVNPGFALGSVGDALGGIIPGKPPAEENFATVLESGLGRTICEHFYFPYARKLWGRDPQDLSAIQARRRVSASSFPRLVRKVLGALPGLGGPGTGRFYYPRGGYGRISEAYARDAATRGAEMCTGATVTSVEYHDDRKWNVRVETGGQERNVAADHVWSTIPLTALVKIMQPPPPEAVRKAADSLEYRAMVLCYLQLDTDQFTEFDAHYFPGEDVSMTRMSEPKIYGNRTEPPGSTVLCAEIPCDVGDTIWTATDEQLGEQMSADLAQVELPLPSTPTHVFTRRLPQAYPIYNSGYEESFGVLDAWASDTGKVLTYGRQGLFAHDNTHHALAMAYAAADCLGADGSFDNDLWADHRREFERHVVED